MQCSGRNVTGWKLVNTNQVFFFLTWRKETIIINYKNTISELHLQEESTTCNEKEILDQIEAY